MESTEKRAKPYKDKETKIIQLGHASSTLAACQNTQCSGTSGGGGEDVKNIDTGRERRSRKPGVIVQRDDDNDQYR